MTPNIPVLKIPFNRFVTFVKPYLNIAGAAVAAWLIAKVNVLGIHGLDSRKDQLATGLTAAGTGIITWGAAQLGDLKWLKGHHIELELGGAAGVGGAVAVPEVHATVEDPGSDPGVEDVHAEQLPGDEEEFGSPPPPEEVEP
jgi:hypothetical protein